MDRAEQPVGAERGVGWVLVGLAALLIAVALARLLIGEPIPLNPEGQIDWSLLRGFLAARRDRLVSGALVGAGLGISGALLQALLRNPLASPYILGVSSGAALGVVLGWIGFSAAGLGGSWLPLVTTFGRGGAALCGALATMLLVYLFSQRRGKVDPLGLLLVGVIINSINGAAIMFISSLYPQGLRSDLFQWMMGYIESGAPAGATVTVAAVILVGWALAIRLGPAMDVATLSDSEAHGLGLALGRLRLVLFGLAGLLTAVTLVLAGPIGFVGLIGPHLVRLRTGPRHRPLLVGAALAGAVLVVGADTAMKAFDVYFRDIGLLPIGAVTVLIGGPAFIFMLRPHLGRGYET
jgi:iron complex transport system permease protein